MTDARKKLSIRSPSADAGRKEAEAAALLAQAMEHHLCVRWFYNRTLMLAAPQILYRKNDSLYCDAVVTERGGMTVLEQKLGSFNIAGLNSVALTTEAFTPWEPIDLSDDRYRAGVVAHASG
ncbi:hypothetical protein [Sphingomonas sp. OTU376]|uniref:hypothetical protein n=1 Tax=Sphingomonas sp. OTU376 TaxID=3043863 RepID=UPI00313DA73D